MNGTRLQRIRHFIEFLCFQIASAFFRILPFAWSGRLGGWLGEKVFTILRYRRAVVLENLQHAFPEAGMPQLVETARRSFRSVGTSLFELLAFPALDREHLRRLVSLKDEEAFRSIIGRRKGVLLVTAHFGNWELVPQAVWAHTGETSLILYKVQSNRLIDGKIAERRKRFGCQLVPMGIAVREILRFLKDGRCVAMAADQSAPVESIWMKFFGREVPVFQGAAAFALKTGSALLATFCIRRPDGTYEFRFKEIPSDDLRGDEAGILELTRRHLSEAEAVIREYPEQWMWMHRRWKHAGARKEKDQAS